MKTLLPILTVFYTYVFVAVYGSDDSAGYPCNVADCQKCSGPNFCGICKPQFVLQMNYNTGQSYCSYNTCNIPNCRMCLQFNSCELCQDGYNVSSQGYCVSSSSVQTNCPKNCLSCSTSLVCNLCVFGYNLQNGNCQPNNGALVPNCQSTFTGFSCQLCNQGYMVDPSYQCTPMTNISCSVSDCYLCNTNDVCAECQIGYELNGGKCQSLTCDVDNCIDCNSTNSSLCIGCQTGYQLNDGDCIPMYIGCNIDNCLVCMQNEICTVCQNGYQPVTYPNAGSMCQQISGSVPIQLNISQIFYYPVTNCLQYGSMILGTSILSTGCILCNEGFILNAGYCVANISLSSYQCSVQNCAYCTQNNYCTQCSDGFISYMGNYQQCIPYYSGQKNCKLTALFSPECAICDDGYTLYQGSCQKSWLANQCSVVGCSYCLDENVCSSCRSGFNLQNGTCTAQCNITSCWQCNNTLCQICQNGYTLVNQSSACQLTSSIAKSNCTTFDVNCVSCNQLQCTQCASNYTLSGNTCCPTPAQNVYGCAVYLSVCSNICIQCQIGFNIVELPYFNFSTQCLNVPCNISNCAFCASATVCGLCQENYTVSNGSCVAYTPNCNVQNCQSCNSSGQCVTCLSGYQPYFGACVCPFQNCVKCMANYYCTICAYPMVTQFGINSKGCLPEVVPNTNCTIQNCVQCQNSQNCAVCEYGFTLTPDGTCSLNQCDPTTNCSLCGFNGTQCYLCNPGYFQESYQSNSCSKVPSDYSCTVFGCELCQTSTQCAKCYDMFYLDSKGFCHENSCVDNCLVCYENNTCSVCMNGFYRFLNTTKNQISCQPINTQTSSNCSGINYCIQCMNNSHNIQCLACYPGLMVNGQGMCVPQVCNILNCQLCMPASMEACLVCKQGYYLNPYYQCEPYNIAITVSQCNVYNCLVCSSNNQCAKCLVGWNRTLTGACVTNLFCTVPNCGNCTYENTCYNCLQNYSLVSGTCTPICNIQNCNTCENLTACKTCAGNLVPSSNASSCVCRDTFVNINATYCGCPAGYTQSGLTCYDCSKAGNCSVCSDTNVCGTCEDTFMKINGSCVCPDESYTFTNGSCQCLNNTTPYNNKCVQCDIEFCTTCTSENNCSVCMNNLKVSTNGTCECLDTYIQNDDDYCVCEKQGYKPNQQDTQCFACGMTNCQYCSADNTCSYCMNNFSVSTNKSSCVCDAASHNVYNNFCYLCDLSYCVNCSADNYCLTCDQTFNLTNGTCSCPSQYSLYNNSCVSCQISNCNFCQQDNVCYQCMPTYLQNQEGSCIYCNINNCLECSSPGFCSSCNSSLSLQVSAEGSSCLNCAISNCSQCFNNGSCATCSNGFALASNQINCVQCNINNCAQCSSTNVCFSCFSGYNLVNNKCTICSYPCATCFDNGTCDTCQSPYSLDSFINGTCFTCTTKNCLNCSRTNPSQCLACKSNYKLSNGKCVYACTDPNCLECFYNGACTACSAGYAPYQGDCYQCSGAPKCVSCSPQNLGICYQCASGYYVANGSCVVCPQSYCETCTSSGCTTFRKSTGLMSLNIGANKNAVYPVVCDPSCATCSSSDPSSCLTCFKGFSNSKGKCLPCAANCRTCSSTNQSLCYSCFSNANLLNNQCQPCQGNCLTCSSTNSSNCLSCVNGYFLTNGTCSQQCPSLCKTCTSATYCTSCQGGYTTSFNGTCLPCLSNCRECAASSPSVCLNCGIGFYLNQQQQQCQSCPSNCKTCNFAGCIECSAGYTLTSIFTCALTCVAPCITCSSLNPTVCYSCISGYNYNSSSNQCVGSPLVINGTTYFCPYGQVLFNNTCSTCSGSNCARCNPNILSQCTSCNYGYYLNSINNTCNSCPQSCQSCSSSTNCLTCIAGYVLPAQSVESSGVCQACQSPCATCFNTPQTCSSCQSGYVLTGWKCQTSFNIGYKLELASSLSNFDQVYYQYLLGLVSALNSTDINIVGLSLLEAGGTSEVNLVSRLLQSNQNTVLNSGNYSMSTTPTNSLSAWLGINKLLGNNSQIAGMTILMSNVYQNDGTIPDDNSDDNGSSGPNLGLILGICIPVGVILIGILIYCLCIRKRSPYPPVDYSGKNKESTMRNTFEMTREDPM